MASETQRANPILGAESEREPSRSEKASLVDRVFFTLVVLIASGLWLLKGRADTGETGGTPVELIVWSAINLLSLGGLFRERAALTPIIRKSWPLVVVTLLPIISSLWSDQHMLTARRSLELLATSGLGAYLVVRLGIRAFVETLAIAIAITAVFSALLVAFVPSIGVQAEFDGAWAGFYSHKNRLGPEMVLGVTSIFCLLDRSRRILKLGQVATAALCLVLLAGSRNAGGVGVGLLLLVVFPLLLLSRRVRSVSPALFGILALAAAAVVATIIGFGSDDAFGALGRDSTFTGRLDVWQLVIAAIAQKPFLGYGYSAFWGADGPAGSLVYSAINWMPATAHNGFLEFAVNFGLVGEILLFALIGIGLRRAAITFWRGSDLLSCWPLFVMIYMLLSNLTDATFAMYNLTDWVAYTAAFLFATENSVMRDPAAANLRVPYRQERATRPVALT